MYPNDIYVSLEPGSMFESLCGNLKMKLLAHSKCPGKLILSGEHSTVYGKKSVATTVDRYTQVKIYDNAEQRNIHLNLINLGFEKVWKFEILKNSSQIIKNINDFAFNGEILGQIKLLMDADGSDQPNQCNYNSCLAFLLLYLSIGDLSSRKCIKVEVFGDLIIGAGLGSSSSYNVSLAKALFSANNIPIELHEFNRWCHEVDKLFHGKPSGVDNSICTYGGAILFAQGKLLEQIDHDDIPELQVILADTNTPRNTKNMVELARNRLAIFPKIGQQLLELIESVSEQVWQSLKSKESNQLPLLFEINQNLLDCLNVSHERIDLAVKIAKNFKCAAKLTGAGGGGVVIIYLTNPDVQQNLIKDLDSNGFKTYQVQLGVPGVKSLNI